MLGASISTRESYAGPVEITVEARTERDNIRLYAFNGAGVIFNWEVNPRELRVNRPDGTTQWESGSLATARVQPFSAKSWHRLKWRITEAEMRVFVDGKDVFRERGKYDLSAGGPIVVRACKSTVDVKSFDVRPIPNK